MAGQAEKRNRAGGTGGARKRAAGEQDQVATGTTTGEQDQVAVDTLAVEQDAAGTQDDAKRAADDPHRDTRAATTAVLKAYANPLRRRILKEFTKREFLRAADIAAALELPANTVSFHLRALAEAGLLAEAPEQARDRRDRVWTGVKGGVSLGGPEHPIEDRVLGDAVLQALLDDHYDVVRRMAAWTPSYLAGEASGVHADFAQQTMRLTEEEFTALMDGIHALKNEATAAHERTHPDPDDPQVRIWQIDIIAADDTI